MANPDKEPEAMVSSHCGSTKQGMISFFTLTQTSFLYESQSHSSAFLSLMFFAWVSVDLGEQLRRGEPGRTAGRRG